MRSGPKDSWKGEIFIWKNEELPRTAQGSVAAYSDIFRHEPGAAETAEGGEEMDISQNSKDECQAERTEIGMAMVLTSIKMGMWASSELLR